MPIALPAGLSPAAHVTDRDVALTYAVDASLGTAPPADFEVVRARDRDDVVAVLAHAHAHGVPVVPQGARSGLAGGSTAVEGGIVVNLEALRAAPDIDPVEGVAVVQPGVVTAELKAAAATYGLFYPPDPASAAFCTVGGNVATNAGGLCCVKYGVTADYVRGLEVVLPGGEVMRTGRRTAKGVAGMDLTGLFVGSEGTLGVVTEVLVRLLPAPDPALTAVATFGSLTTAAEAVLVLRGERHRPSLLEILDAPTLAAIRVIGDFGYPPGSAAVLVVQSDRPGHTQEDVQGYAARLAAAGATEVAVADDQQEADALLAGRRALNRALEVKGRRFVEDVCVPVSRLARLIQQGQDIGARHGVEVTMSGHAGDGNLHPCFFFTDGVENGPGSRAAAEAAFGDLVDVALALGGTITGEHGVGSLKAPYLPRELGPGRLARQRAVKAVFDPRSIMNPGKVFLR